MPEIININDFDYNPELGFDVTVVVLIKWLNQSYHDENLRSMFTGEWDDFADVSKQNSYRHRNQYYDGLIAQFDLGVDYLDHKNATFSIDEVQPTDIHIEEGKFIIAAGNRLVFREDLFSPGGRELINPWFARLHSVCKIGQLLMTTSSSFDDIYLLNPETGEVKQRYDLWATGRDTNTFGHTFRKVPQIEALEDYQLNPDIDSLKAKNDNPNLVNLITDPNQYNGLGLPTFLTPTFVNHATIDSITNMIIATTLNTGECLVIDPESREVDTVMNGLLKPHGFYNYKGKYLLTETGRERLHILNEDFEQEKIYTMEYFTDKKPGLELARWLQNVDQIGDSLLIAINSPRQKLTLIDIESQQYRDVPFDDDWGVQTVKTLAV